MYVVGPVQSRRLGRSLVVSPLPNNTCSYACVYCPFGGTACLQAKRDSFYSKEDILFEILGAMKEGTPEFITFAGNGEPTLCKDLGWLIRHVKMNLRIPVAVVTNSSMLFRKDVRQDLEQANIVMLKLDAGDEKKYWAVNRPHESIDFCNLLQGLVGFCHEFTGRTWLEIMLVKGLNDSIETLRNIESAVEAISPDRVYMRTPIYSPAEPWVEAPGHSGILLAQQIIEHAILLQDLEDGPGNLVGFADVG